MLLGSEIKSMREGKASINESYVAEVKGELFLINCNISEYKPANRFNHDLKRPRKLLLHKKELNKIIGKMQMHGYSAIPLKIYFNKKNFAKILIGLGRGKKLYDKRETIKKRDENRRKQRGEEWDNCYAKFCVRYISCIVHRASCFGSSIPNPAEEADFWLRLFGKNLLGEFGCITWYSPHSVLSRCASTGSQFFLKNASS